jgi:galactokinase/mevalonate kinase-like predicted kinase
MQLSSNSLACGSNFLSRESLGTSIILALSQEFGGDPRALCNSLRIAARNCSSLKEAYALFAALAAITDLKRASLENRAVLSIVAVLLASNGCSMSPARQLEFMARLQTSENPARTAIRLLTTEHIRSHFDRTIRHESTPSRTRPVVIVDAPARIDLGMAGISDIPPYCQFEPGLAVNVSAYLDGAAPLRCTVEILKNRSELVIDLGTGEQKVRLDQFDDTTTNGFPSPEAYAAALFFKKTLGVISTDNFFCGAGNGLRITIQNSLGFGTGLGISSAAIAALVRALGLFFGINLSFDELVAYAVYVEAIAGNGGGWEDVAALEHGWRRINTTPESPWNLKVCELAAAAHFGPSQVMLFDTGLCRQRAIAFQTIQEAYLLGKQDTLRALASIRAASLDGVAAIQCGDYAAVGDVFSTQWNAWKSLTGSACDTDGFNNFVDRVRRFVYGARLLGAGAGRFGMLVARDGMHTRIAVEFRKIFQAGRIVHWSVVQSTATQ